MGDLLIFTRPSSTTGLGGRSTDPQRRPEQDDGSRIRHRQRSAADDLIDYACRLRAESALVSAAFERLGVAPNGMVDGLRRLADAVERQAKAVDGPIGAPAKQSH